jgi:hypothetical protein
MKKESLLLETWLQKRLPPGTFSMVRGPKDNKQHLSAGDPKFYFSFKSCKYIEEKM